MGMKKQNYIFSRFERYFGSVSRSVWVKMLRIASDLDLDKGGIYDARSGCINIWVSPEDKPEDYNFEINRGRLKYPRNYLATIYANYVNDNKVELYLTITNYARRDYAQMLLEEREISFKEYLRIKEISEKGTEAEWRWAEEKARWLIDIAVKESVFKEVIYCPFCGKEFPNLKMFNDFVLHIATHVRVESVLLGADGTYIETEKGTLTPNDYIREKLVKKETAVES